MQWKRFCARAEGCVAKSSKTNLETRALKGSPTQLQITTCTSSLLHARHNKIKQIRTRHSSGCPAVWETFVFAQLRDRERRAGRTGSLFFWRDRTREVDFVVDAGGRLDLFEAKWTELPDVGDTVNLDFVCNVVGKSRVAADAIVWRTPSSFPLANGFRAVPATELR